MRAKCLPRTIKGKQVSGTVLLHLLHVESAGRGYMSKSNAGYPIAVRSVHTYKLYFYPLGAGAKGETEKVVRAVQYRTYPPGT